MRLRTVRAGLLAVAATLVCAGPASAITYNVNSVADAPDADTGDPACATAAAECTIRAALEQAAVQSEPALINVPPGGYLLGPQLVVAAGSPAVTLAGTASRGVVIDGDLNGRVLSVNAGAAPATVRNVAISRGSSDTDGGGIRVADGSTLVLESTTVRSSTTGGDGGGLHAGENSAVTLRNSTFSSNTAQDDGGAIEFDGTRLGIVNTTFDGNSADFGPVADGDGDGGALELNEGVTTVVHATLAGNSAGEDGGAVNVQPEGPMGAVSARFMSSIVSGNTAGGTGPNCFRADPGVLESGGTNLESGTDCGFGASGDRQSANPSLGPLADNGGATDTRALPPGSPAVDAAATAGAPGTDQRGVARPRGIAPDIGAFEREVSADLAVTMTAAPVTVTRGDEVQFDAVVRNAGTDTAHNLRLTDDLPRNTEFVSVSPAAGCTRSGTVVACELGVLAPGGARTLAVRVRTTTAGRVENVARASATEPDPNGLDNQSSAVSQVTESEAPPGESPEGGGDEGDGGDGGGTDGEEASRDLPFTGLGLLALVATGILVCASGLTLRLLIRRR